MIDTGFPDGNLHPVLQINGSSISTEVVYFNVTNVFSSEIRLVATIAASNIGPTTLVLHSNVTIHSNHSVRIGVFVSYDLIASGYLTGWTTKVIKLSFWKVKQPHIKYLRQLDLQPASTGCATVLDQNLCSQLPSCLYCLVSPTIRLLQEVHPAENESMSLSSVIRKLFVDIVPSGLSNYDSSGDIPGFCMESTDPASCGINSANRLNHHWLPLLGMTILALYFMY